MASSGKAIGKDVAVEGVWECVSCDENGSTYERYDLSNGHTCFVSGLHTDDPKVTVSGKPASKSSYSVRNFLARQMRKAAHASKRAGKGMKRVKYDPKILTVDLPGRQTLKPKGEPKK